MADPRAFAKLPVSELADRSHVSKPTVVRFCRSVGYDGLADFKRKLAGTVNEGVPFIHRSVDADDKTSDVMVKVIDNTVSAFLKYRNEASSVAVEKAVTALVNAYQNKKQIQFFGIGDSGHCGQRCATSEFLSAGHQHHCLQRRPHAGHERIHSVSRRLCGGHQQLQPHPRPDGCLRPSRKNAATVIVITTSGSPLASEGRIHLSADHPEGFDRYSPMVSRLLHLMIIDILVTCVALSIGADTLQPLLVERE